MELGRTSHTVYKIKYHFVTAVKYRKVLLKPEVEDCIIVIDELGFDEDHIHIFCRAKQGIVQVRFFHR